MLNKKQKKCIELMAAGEMTQREIAKQIDIAEETISRWKKDKEFMLELDELVRVGIQSLAAKAFRTMSGLLCSKNDMVKYMASKDILDRSGFKADDKLKIEGMIPIVIKDDLEAGDSD